MRNVIDVPYLDQSVRYPTGCESVSAVMLLRYLGYEMSVDEFIEQYLDRQEFELREGELYGPDPTKYFCGSPYDEESFGCYAPVITQALKKAKYLPGFPMSTVCFWSDMMKKDIISMIRMRTME